LTQTSVTQKEGQLVYDWDMQVIMNDGNLQTIEQVRQFLGGSEALFFRLILQLE